MEDEKEGGNNADKKAVTLMNLSESPKCIALIYFCKNKDKKERIIVKFDKSGFGHYEQKSRGSQNMKFCDDDAELWLSRSFLYYRQFDWGWMTRSGKYCFTICPCHFSFPCILWETWIFRIIWEIYSSNLIDDCLPSSFSGTCPSLSLYSTWTHSLFHSITAFQFMAHRSEFRK